MGPPGRCSREFGMKWRVMLELVGPDGTVGVHEVGGRAAVAEYVPQMIGLTLEEGKHLLAMLQVHLVQAQAEDHSRRRRRCQRCGAQRPVKDQRSRQLVSLFGTVEVRVPRFTPCRCAVTCRRTLNPVAEIMPDRCTPEHERTIAKMGSLLPYRRARTLLAEFLPLGKPQPVETARQRTLRVGTRVEQEAVAGAGSKPSVATKSIALSIDGGHVRAARQYQGRTFEVLLAQVSNDEGKQVVFASVPAEATSQTRQLRGVLHGLGATPETPVTILSDGADGPRSLGEAASPGPTHHVLDCWGGRPHGIEVPELGCQKPRPEPSMSHITRIGIDTSKAVFTLHCVDDTGRAVLQTNLRRAQMVAFFKKLSPTEIVMEACGSSHHWGRELSALGHDVRLIPPQYVKPFVKRAKNDRNDAEAICEAGGRPGMRFVPVKSAEQQAQAMVLKVRETLVGQRTQLANTLRGHAAEFGVVAGKGIKRIVPLLEAIEADAAIPAEAREMLARLGREIEHIDTRLVELDVKLIAMHKANPLSQLLATIPGIGVIIALTFAIEIDPAAFESGRHLAAWIGLTPKEHSTGGKQRFGWHQPCRE
jgi:transposase